MNLSENLSVSPLIIGEKHLVNLQSLTVNSIHWIDQENQMSPKDSKFSEIDLWINSGNVCLDLGISRDELERLQRWIYLPKFA